MQLLGDVDVLFLSHLCGEEEYRPELESMNNFLSHLCGEEEVRRR